MYLVAVATEQLSQIPRSTLHVLFCVPYANRMKRDNMPFDFDIIIERHCSMSETYPVRSTPTTIGRF